MIDLSSFGTPNGREITVCLEEMGLPDRVHVVDITKAEQFAPDFLRIAPNNLTLASVDPDGPGGSPVACSRAGRSCSALGRRPAASCRATSPGESPSWRG